MDEEYDYVLDLFTGKVTKEKLTLEEFDRIYKEKGKMVAGSREGIDEMIKIIVDNTTPTVPLEAVRDIFELTDTEDLQVLLEKIEYGLENRVCYWTCVEEYRKHADIIKEILFTRRLESKLANQIN